MLSPDVAEFLSTLLGQQALQVGHPKFGEMAAMSIKAKAELDAIITPGEIDVSDLGDVPLAAVPDAPVEPAV